MPFFNFLGNAVPDEIKVALKTSAAKKKNPSPKSDQQDESGMLVMPKSLKTMRIKTRKGMILALTHQRSETYPGTQSYGAYGGLIHAMRRGARYPEKSRTFLTQLCVPIDQVELKFGENSRRYHSTTVDNDVTPTCKRCLQIMRTAKRI